MPRLFVHARVAVAAALILAACPAVPQVPPHYPGTLCFTPYFWCPLQFAIPVGTPCYCNGPYGPVYGRAG